MLTICVLLIVAAAIARGYGIVGAERAAAVNAGRATAQSAPPPGASRSVRVTVPASMRTNPFNTDRYLNVPLDFQIAVYARIPRARFMAVAPNGDLLVSQPDHGKVSLVRPNPNGDPLVSNFVTGLRRPHDIVFHTIDGVTYVYIAETHQIDRFIYNYGDMTAHDRQLIVTNLPDAEITGELGGAHNHALKNIAIDSQHNLYVSNASATNADPSDLAANPKRAAIYVYDARVANVGAAQGQLFASGLRNAEGLAFRPGTDELWVVVNNRDQIAYPFHNDYTGDGTDDYGKVLAAYVDNHPPEEFTRVRDGGNYGWPYANPNPDTPAGLNDMPFDLDVQNNADGRHGSADSFDRITKGIQAHSAPLGLSFLQGTNFPARYREGAVVGYHGSWNRTQRTGYKVAYFPWDAARNAPGDEIDLVTGWVINNNQDVWGRPVDAIVDPQGALFISDDQSGTIYKLTYAAAPAPTPTPTPSEWSICANENQRCNFTGTRRVRYGANGSYSIATHTNGVDCSNNVFGDPIFGVAKRCEVEGIAQPTPTPTPTPAPPEWTFCAEENQRCNFSGTREVRYGAGGTYATLTRTDGVECSNSVFGDPIFGVVKRCEVRAPIAGR